MKYMVVGLIFGFVLISVAACGDLLGLNSSKKATVQLTVKKVN